jgi:hypothetical protein
MKKITISLFLITSFIIVSKAQQIVNGNFENWTVDTLFEEPDGYLSTNSWIYTIVQGGNVKRVAPASHGQFACQLTTVSNATDTMFGGLFIGTPGNQTINGGMPFTGQPDSVSVYVKYDIKPLDTAYILIGFKKAGVIVGMAMRSFHGTQASYKRMSMPTNLSVIPDSLVALISCSNLDYPKIPGSTLTLDSITFIGSTQQIPNPSFENWTPFETEEPDSWNTLNYGKTSIPSATKSISSYSGSYALRLETITTTWGDTTGYVTNGKLGPGGPAGGMQVFGNPSKITGYYKYIPVGNDTALGAAFTFRNSVMIENRMIAFTPKTTYTYFEIPFSYSAWPYIDTLDLFFSSSNMQANAFMGLGSVLFIDSLNVLYLPTGLADEGNSIQFSVYPNPFSSTALISFPDIHGEVYDFLLFDMLGNVVMRKEAVFSNTIVIDRSNLLSGIYEYKALLRNTGKPIAAGKLMIR